MFFLVSALWHLHHGRWGWHPVWPFPCHSTSTRPWNCRAKEETRCMLIHAAPLAALHVGSIRKQWIVRWQEEFPRNWLGPEIPNSIYKCQSNSINVIPGIPQNVPSTLLLETAIPRGNPPNTLPLCSNMFSLAGNKHWHVHHVQWKKWSRFTKSGRNRDLTGLRLCLDLTKDPVGVEEDFSWDQVHDISYISWHCLSTWHIWKTMENNDPSLPDSIDDCSPSHRPGAQQIPSWKCYCNLKSAKWPRSIKIQPWKRLDIKWKTKMHVQCSITLPLGYKMILQRLNGKEAQTSMNRR